MLDTPERRAGLKHRLGDLTRQIGDETLRRYYQQELYGRLDALTGAARRAAFPGQRPSRQASSFAASPRPRFGSPPPLRGYRGSAPARLSDGLARAGGTASAGFARRDVEILTIVMNHPALLDHYAEELAHLSLDQPAMAKLRDVMVELVSDHVPDHEAFKRALDSRGVGDLRRQIQALAERAPLWSTGVSAAIEDAEASLRQAMALHRRARELHKDLQEARDALGRDPSEGRLAELRDIQAHLGAVEGMEAMIEGYGTLSGHKSSGD